jgi:hypothetical protein
VIRRSTDDAAGIPDRDLTDTEMDVIKSTVAMAFKDGYARGVDATRMFPELTIFLWMCPWCKGGTDPFDVPAGCLHCGGAGMTNDVGGWEPHELTRAPLPPTLMKAPCAGCALREGSPESERADSLRFGADNPFWCHAGLVGDDEKGYSSPAMMGELPFGAFVCRGWWDLYIEENGKPLRPYKDVSASRDGKEPG